MWYIFSLGCGIGYGYLHRIPIRSIEPEKKALIPPLVKQASDVTSNPVVTPEVASTLNVSTHKYYLKF